MQELAEGRGQLPFLRFTEASTAQQEGVLILFLLTGKQTGPLGQPRSALKQGGGEASGAGAEGHPLFTG